MSPVSLDAVRAALSADEPNYPQIAGTFGPAALPHLATLAAGSDTRIASRAVALAGFIAGADRTAIVQAASRRPEPRMKLAAAAAAPKLAVAEAATVVEALLDDAADDVRHAALAAVKAWPTDELLQRVKSRVADLSRHAPESWIRAQAVEVARAKGVDLTAVAAGPLGRLSSGARRLMGALGAGPRRLVRAIRRTGR